MRAHCILPVLSIGTVLDCLCRIEKLMNMSQEIGGFFFFLAFGDFLWSLFSLFGFRLHTCHMHTHMYNCIYTYVHEQLYRDLSVHSYSDFNWHFSYFTIVLQDKRR